MRCLIIVMGCVLMVSVAVAEPLICVYRTNEPPTIDGMLDDECWKEASITSPFLSLSSSVLPDEQTRARLCWDDQNLYIAAEAFDACLEPRLNMLHAVKAEQEGKDARVFTDDCIEIFLQPGEDSYYHFAANSGDGTYDARGTDSVWNSGWTCEARRLHDRYVLEIAIPFAAIEGAPKGQWRANFARERTAVEELSTWAELANKFHEPEAFGTLCFKETGPAVTEFAIQRHQSEYVFNAEIGGLANSQTQLSITMKAGEAAVSETAVGKGHHSMNIAPPTEAYESGRLWIEYVLRQANEVILSSASIPDSLAAAVVKLNVNATDARAQVFLNGKPVSAENGILNLMLTNGLNSIAMQVQQAGDHPGVDPVLWVADRAIKAKWLVNSDVEGSEWRTTIPEYGWRRPRAVRSGVWARDDGETANFVCNLYVAEPLPQLFPKLRTYHMPKDSSQLVRLYVHIPTELSSEGYRMVVEAPSFLKYCAVEPLSGGDPVVEAGDQFELNGFEMTQYRINYEQFPHQGMQLSLRWGDENGDPLNYQPALHAGGTHDWRHMSTTVTAPESAASVHPLIIKWQNHGITGTFWVDNVSLRKKGTNENLLKMGTFDEPEWGKSSWLAAEGVGGSMACKIVSTKQNADKQQACWVDKEELTPVEPGEEYVIELDVKCQNVGVSGQRPVVGLLFDAPGDCPEGDFPFYTYFETMYGKITEVPRKSTIKMMPALNDVRPEHARIAPCYYGSSLGNEKVGKAYADNCWKSGITWTYGLSTNNVASHLLPRGLSVFWSIGWHPYRTVGDAGEFLQEHPEYQAVDFNGNQVNNTFCPTWFLAHRDNVGMQEIEKWLVETLNESEYYGANWDLEHGVIDPPTFCTCARCLSAFRTFADLAEDEELTPDILLEEYPGEWTDFRCHQNAEMAGILRDFVHKADRPVEFSIYSGYQSRRTKEHYGVDWELMAPNIDFGIAGYGGGTKSITDTMKALGETPFMGGEMWYLHHNRDPRPAPKMQTWCNRILRQYVTSGCNGCLIWWLGSMDGAAFYATSKATAVIAEYEDYFKAQKDGEILVLLLNFSDDPTDVTIAIGENRYQRTIEAYGTEILLTDAA